MREQTLQQIEQLESHKMKASMDGSSVSSAAPRFTSPISNSVLKEGENAHFEARLTPTDDANMSIEWFWNGKALKAGSRIRTFCDFGLLSWRYLLYIQKMLESTPAELRMYLVRL
eukprot:TRINITY_DN32239_c0_g1_i1.p1 TRINITY_DN32239_c0_g1~~TRINITY_DN32239_c0_g1_i1.p1  ORF type:complete len:115 (+),score=34.20 TRINITY_DN32239_c0_g1_i1:79-423(+)